MSELTPQQASLIRAIEATGNTQRGFAEALSKQSGRPVSQQNVWWWINKSGRAPAEFVLHIEALTGVSRHDLRPDVYGVGPLEAA